MQSTHPTNVKFSLIVSLSNFHVIFDPSRIGENSECSQCGWLSGVYVKCAQCETEYYTDFNLPKLVSL